MSFPPKKGTYIIVFNYGKSRMIKVKSGKFFIEKGRYCYIGSAFGSGGIFSRIQRHLKKRKKKHWHLDFLSVSPFFKAVSVYCFFNLKIECEIAEKFLKVFYPVAGFGASDCSCISHLFFMEDKNSREIDRIVKEFQFEKFDLRG
ncbi:GIY-YIG nuclease family protein [Desulfurobacterium atlanticum]|uniref:Uri superfamily endonuclease n=1 Tax=Desulfurobacterium atlanticum TaxID=240169 RepID=A0A238YH86_9BACT|nr:DUF123 domain-containing protein [Desulfurobacterium atlanticum]SNR70148.1 Uri superfamily endonuclease [Desulfurobacterium atlanticum]